MQAGGVQASTVSSFFPVVVVSVFPFFFLSLGMFSFYSHCYRTRICRFEMIR